MKMRGNVPIHRLQLHTDRFPHLEQWTTFQRAYRVQFRLLRLQQQTDSTPQYTSTQMLQSSPHITEKLTARMTHGFRDSAQGTAEQLMMSSTATAQLLLDHGESHSITHDAPAVGMVPFHDLKCSNSSLYLALRGRNASQCWNIIFENSCARNKRTTSSQCKSNPL